MNWRNETRGWTARITRTCLAATLFVTCTAGARAADELAPYKAKGPVSGDLSSIGSDTLNNLMTYWAEAFHQHHPNVKIGIEGKGSGAAPTNLAEGSAQLGPMSRFMTAAERDAILQKRKAEKVLEFTIAVDCVAIYVHRDNPVAGLTLEQLDSLFSKNRLRGGPDAPTWGAVGLAGDWAGRTVSLYGRNSASGTYAFFKELVLNKGDYKDTVKEQPGSAAVVDGVAGDMGGVGYSGIGYKTSNVRTVPLAEKTGGPFVEPSGATAIDGTYPLGRGLFVYVVKMPGQPLEPAVAEFLRFALSKEGQALVEKAGEIPVTPEMAADQLKLIE